MNNPVIVETKLEDVLVSIQKDLIATVKTDLATVKEDVKDLKNTYYAQIWALIITVMGATLAAVIKFGFMPNP